MSDPIYELITKANNALEAGNQYDAIGHYQDITSFLLAENQKLRHALARICNGVSGNIFTGKEIFDISKIALEIDKGTNLIGDSPPTSDNPFLNVRMKGIDDE